MKLTGRGLVALVLACAAAACTDTSSSDQPSSATFTALPVPLESPGCVDPIGAVINTYPTGSPDLDFDLVYGGNTCPGTRDYLQGTPVFAAANTTVAAIDTNNDGVWIVVSVNSMVSYEYYGISATPTLERGAPVQAGEEIGTTQSFNVLHAGVINLGVTQPFVAPERYPARYLHADEPTKYFNDSLRALLRARGAMPAATAPLAQDVAGTLAGNWFAPDVPDDSTATGSEVSYLSKRATFRIDAITGQPIVVVDVSLLGDDGCTCYVGAGSTPFDRITPQSGPVIYYLYYNARGNQTAASFHGSLMVQLDDAGHLREPVYPGVMVTDTAFTDASQLVR